MDKPLYVLTAVSLLFLSCNFWPFEYSPETPDNFINDVLNDPRAQYTLSGSVDTLDSIPPVLLSLNETWIFHTHTWYSYSEGGDSSVGYPCTLKVTRLTDSSVTFNGRVTYACSSANQLANSVTIYNNTTGQPLPPAEYRFSTVIKMDDGSYTFRAEKDTGSYSQSDMKIINSWDGVLYERWRTSTGWWMEYNGGYYALLTKNGINVPLGKKLNEYYAKDSVVH